MGCRAGAHKATPLRKLVCEPLTNFKKVLGKDSDLEAHQNHKYHTEAVEAGKAFLRTYHNVDKEVNNMVNQHRRDLVKSNRERLVPIIRACLFLGRQGLAFRGHRDDGALKSEMEEKDTLFKDNADSVLPNQGNFREVLRLMAGVV